MVRSHLPPGSRWADLKKFAASPLTCPDAIVGCNVRMHTRHRDSREAQGSSGPQLQRRMAKSPAMAASVSGQLRMVLWRKWGDGRTIRLAGAFSGVVPVERLEPPASLGLARLGCACFVWFVAPFASRCACHKMHQESGCGGFNDGGLSSGPQR